MSALAALARELRTRLGLDIEALGPGALAHAVRGRARARALDEAAYLDALARDSAEWQALVEALLVPETWFFRDRGPFALLSHWATHAWAGRDARHPVSVLSLPCSTGEEAWSIAITLAAAGLAPDAFRIDAADLSERALAVARAGHYRPRALRGGPLDPAWARYLHRGADGHLEVAAALRPSVTFQRANLVDAPRVFAGRRFDCVFCRNLLIYCDDAARRAAVAGFTALLHPDGLLVLGHAETLPPDTTDFVREGPANAFAWRRAAAPAIASRNAQPGGASPVPLTSGGRYGRAPFETAPERTAPPQGERAPATQAVQWSVTPAEAGVQNCLNRLDSRFRGNDGGDRCATQGSTNLVAQGERGNSHHSERNAARPEEAASSQWPSQGQPGNPHHSERNAARPEEAASSQWPSRRAPAGYDASKSTTSGTRRRARAPRRAQPSLPIPGTGLPARPSRAGPSPSTDLARARVLADRGALDEAAAIAAARVAAVPADAAAHALLGIVRAAQGRDRDAIEHLRRALYLDPVHEDALGHLAVLLEHQGDDAGAARLRARLRRLDEVTP